MPAYKDKSKGTWYVSFYYVNWKGERERKLKRGFATKREALDFEREFLQQKTSDLTMSFEAFAKLYTADMKNRIRQHTWQTKNSIIEGKLKPTDRIFPITKSYLHHEMDRGSKAQEVKRIRIHDIRHSHVSLLIEMGFSAVAIADRVGHESIDITYRYAHLFPTKQAEIANKLSIERDN